ncbi:DUF5753 domain-containing protein [Lentzea tibetensis]|uniref:DUF5753 domain-containing protein n=1 Tax=Lentzea tibetensis TaxID=2591470 RepID=UPI00164430A6|nr:DUF5753 domain-containing protein [Lentzea tibetensis]
MGVDDSPAYYRKALGRQLRRLRRAAGYSVEAAHRQLELSDTTLHRMELGKTKVTIHTAKSMLDLYGVGADEWEPILELVRIANRKGWWARFGLTNKHHTALETAASVIWAFCFGYLHGLLQTEAYMRAVFHTSISPRTESQVANQVEIRKIRQRRLADPDDSLELVAVIDESALRRLVGGRDVMRAQLQHLLDQSEASIQVLPAEVGAHLGFFGSFSVLEFPDPEEPAIGYYEHITGPTFVNRAADVDTCKLTFGYLRSIALSMADSRVLIEQIMAEL